MAGQIARVSDEEEARKIIEEFYERFEGPMKN
jgi:hypothetical protein